MKKISALIFILLATRCTEIKNDRSTNQSDTPKPHAPKPDTTYLYEPIFSTLSGTLHMEVFWGPPNFGEDTTVDARERCPVLYLDNPINIAEYKKNEFNTPKTGITKIQLLSKAVISDFNGKRITAKGKLFGAHTGHHHTEVLMHLSEIKEDQVRD